MRKFLTTTLLLLSFTGFAQTKNIDITTDMFVQLVFQTAIQNVKTGAPDLVLADYSENSLTIQALANDIKTNISVKTADGFYYSFVVHSKTEVSELFYAINPKTAINRKKETVTPTSDTVSVETQTPTVDTNTAGGFLEEVFNEDGFIRNRNTQKYKKIYLSILGVYSRKDKLYFLFNMKNKSSIIYDIENIKFITAPIIKAKQKLNSDSKEYVPLFFHKNLNNIPIGGSKRIVAVFNKFTINDEKKLEITLNENNGERTVKLNLSSDYISNAKSL